MIFTLLSRAQFALACSLTLLCFVPQTANAQSPEPLALPSIELEAGGTVFALERLADGRIVLGGRFNSVNGQSRSNLALVDADGHLNMAWAPSVNGDVRVIVSGAAGEIFIGGDFTQIDGQPRLRLAKLDTNVSSGSSLELAWNPGADGTVHALVYDSGGAVFVGGAFSTVGGGSRSRLAKLAATGNGSLVSAFQPQNLNGGPLVQALALDEANNLVYAGGQVAGPGGRQFLRRYNTENGAWGVWNPDPNGRVSALHLAANGDLFVGGEFTFIGGQARQRLARISTGTTAAATAFLAHANGRVVRFALDTSDANPVNHQLYVAGEYSSIGGQPRERLARVNAASGAVDSHWMPNPNGDIYSVVLSAGHTGQLIAGGPFSRIGGFDARGIARLLDANGEIDRAFVANAVQAGVILTLQPMPDGSTYLGGVFDAVRNAGDPVFETGFSNLLRLDANGELDATWKPQVNGNIQVMRVDDGELLLGGTFVSVDTQPRDRLARLVNGSGGLVLDPAWTPGVDGEVRDMQLAGGALFIGGEFQNAGDGVDSAPRVNLVQFDAASGALSAVFVPQAPDARVLALTVADAALFVGGEFALIGSQPREALAKFDAIDGVLNPWNPGVMLAGAAGSIRALAAVDDDGLLVGGSFSSLAGEARSNFGRISRATGAVTDYYAPVVDGRVDALVLDADNAAYIGGNFTAINGHARLRLARLGPVGDIDRIWAATADGSVGALALRHGSDASLLAAGFIFNVSGQPREGVAALPTTLDDTAAVSAIEVSSVSASVTGQAFAVNVQVRNLNTEANAATGMVAINDGSHTCKLTLVEADAGSGSCVFPARNASESPLTIMAFFESDNDDLMNAIGAPFTHHVSKAETTLEIVSTMPAEPTAGESVEIAIDFSVVAPGHGIPTGLVTVSNGDDSCQVDVGLAESGCNLIFDHAGMYTVTANYPGDVDFHGDTAMVMVSVSGVQMASSISFDGSSPNPSAPGESVSFDFSVVPTAASGLVEVRHVSDDSVVCSGSLDVGSGMCVAAFGSTDLGGVVLYAAYLGDDQFLGSHSTPIEHDVALIATTLELGISVSDPGDIRVGDSVTFSWQVTAARTDFGVLSGTVVVVSGDDSCSADLDDGSCDITLTVFGEAVAFVASYSGNSVFAPSADVLTLEILETPREVSVDAAIRKRVRESLVLLSGGDWVMYEIVVTNQGADPIAAADVLDEMPAEFDITSVTWECEGFDGGQCGVTSDDGDLMATVALPSGGSVRYLLVGFIPEFTDQSWVVNTALVDAGEDDIDPSNNQSMASYQRCAPNRQSEPGDLELRAHSCVFRDGYEASFVP